MRWSREQDRPRAEHFMRELRKCIDVKRFQIALAEDQHRYEAACNLRRRLGRLERAMAKTRVLWKRFKMERWLDVTQPSGMSERKVREYAARAGIDLGAPEGEDR